MTAPAITLTAGEAEAIDAARTALSWVDGDDFPWPGDSGLLRMNAAGLRESLEDHARLTADSVHPADLFPELGHGQDNATELALELVAADIREWTSELVRLGKQAEEAARAREEREAA